MENWKDSYPNRYYAYASANRTINGFPIVGWANIALYTTKPTWLPDAAAMIPLTEEEWNARKYEDQVIKDGQVATETPIAPVIPLKTQAETLLKSQQAYVMQNYAIYGDETPTEWLTYLKALREIASGTDTTSTTLPTAPATS
ncbi:hypothetical protein [Acetobacter orientalis]|uniref:hypothetical protein n=1 Tax=Acetobacter orientalis TaxID=146474 RepID=UPI00241C8A74|nr:hypothetical protein [Acetobacter orientalis]